MVIIMHTFEQNMDPGLWAVNSMNMNTYDHAIMYDSLQVMHVFGQKTQQVVHE